MWCQHLRRGRDVREADNQRQVFGQHLSAGERGQGSRWACGILLARIRELSLTPLLVLSLFTPRATYWGRTAMSPSWAENYKMYNRWTQEKPQEEVLKPCLSWRGSKWNLQAEGELINSQWPACGKLLLVCSPSPPNGNRKKLAALHIEGPIILIPLGARCNNIKHDELFPYSIPVSLWCNFIGSIL